MAKGKSTLKVSIQEGYQPGKKGYQPTQGNLDRSNPPKGGSGVQSKRPVESPKKNTTSKK